MCFISKGFVQNYSHLCILYLISLDINNNGRHLIVLSSLMLVNSNQQLIVVSGNGTFRCGSNIIQVKCLKMLMVLSSALLLVNRYSRHGSYSS